MDHQIQSALSKGSGINTNYKNSRIVNSLSSNICGFSTTQNRADAVKKTACNNRKIFFQALNKSINLLLINSYPRINYTIQNISQYIDDDKKSG
jgi:hypothetical protein